MLRGTNLKYAKEHNHRIVLETIRLHGPVSRADIARRTELTAQTVSNIVRKLMDQHLVQEVRKRQQGRGAPSTLLGLNAEATYTVGLDLDRDHVTAVLTDLSGNVRDRYHSALNFPSPQETVELMVKVTRQLLDQQDLTEQDLRGIGIGFPGPITISDSNRVLSSVNPKAFPSWEHVPLVSMLEEHLTPPIFLENNATAAAIGERWHGSGQQISSFFYIYFGSGLGGGIIIGGQPYEGYSKNAGELGYIQDGAQTNGEVRHIGEHFNLPSLYEKLQQEGFEASTPPDLLRLFNQDEDCLMDWLDQAVRTLAPIIQSIEYLLDPEAVFFGGRLPEPIVQAIMDGLADTLEESRTLIEDKTFAPSLRLGTAGSDAAAFGVATLPLYDLFAATPQRLLKNKREHSA